MSKNGYKLMKEIKKAGRKNTTGQIVVRLREDDTAKMVVAPLSYHFVGVGGCGMSGLAQVLAQKGHQITGSDSQSSEVTENLERTGIQVNIGHRAESVPRDVDCVVVSAAVPENNPEWLQAQEQGVRVYKYAQMLGELSRQMSTLAVAGTHGKSTTSGWLAYVLQQADMEPSFVIGAEVGQLGGGSGAGKGKHIVVEACEYDRSFLNLRPRVGAILNVELDHLDYYHDINDIVNAFGEFAGLISEDGLLVANGDDDNVVQALSLSGRRNTDNASCRSIADGTASGPTRCEYFSLEDKGDWQVRNLRFEAGQGCFDLIYRGIRLESVKLALAGVHNVANALAVAAMARSVGVSVEQICAGLEGFTGVDRRLTYKGNVQGVVVLDDYAHHPTEIQTTLEAIAAKYCRSERPGRLWCVFQPHQHSRTRFFLSEFASSFRWADIVLLPDIYFVRESEQLRREVNAGQLADRINENGGEARYMGEFDNIVNTLAREVQAGDVVVTMGAGDVWKVADELICRLG